MTISSKDFRDLGSGISPFGYPNGRTVNKSSLSLRFNNFFTFSLFILPIQHVPMPYAHAAKANCNDTKQVSWRYQFGDKSLSPTMAINKGAPETKGPVVHSFAIFLISSKEVDND